MSHTETEAKTKWCPHARIGVSASHGGPSAINAQRNAQRCAPEHRANCIASECAMWRWATKGMACANIDPTGYCGLAGRPGVAS